MRNICSDYGPCEKITIKNFGELSGEWYFISATPVNLKENNKRIISDIIKGNEISTYNGTVIHNPNCECLENTKLSKYFDMIYQLEEKIFVVAIFDNKSSFLSGQPLAICIDPVITFINYPSHPHLNTNGMINNTFVPPTICYTNDVPSLGNMLGDRIYDAMHYITIWLYRHQLYELISKYYKEQDWIGDEDETKLPSYIYFHMINPFGRCHCGSELEYIKCCIQEDAKKYYEEKSGKNVCNNKDVKLNSLLLKNQWEQNYALPENLVIQRLKKEFKKTIR